MRRRREELLARSEGCMWLAVFLYAFTGIVGIWDLWLMVVPGFGSIAAYVMCHELLSKAYKE